MRIILAAAVNKAPERSCVLRRSGEPGVIGFLINKGMGEGEINPDQKRASIGDLCCRCAFDQPVMNSVPPPVTTAFGKDGARDSTARQRLGKLDSRLARSTCP